MYGIEAVELLEGSFFLLLYCQRTVSSTSPAMIYNVFKRIQTCRQLLRSSLVLKMRHVNQLRAITGIARSGASTWLNACRQESTVHQMSLEFTSAGASFLLWSHVCICANFFISFLCSVRDKSLAGHHKLCIKAPNEQNKIESISS